jgi:hypothetical protein
MNIAQRADAVKSLTYEAEARVRDPVYGCVGLISQLQDQVRNLENELVMAKKQLASFHAIVPLPLATTTESSFSSTSSAQHFFSKMVKEEKDNFD